MFETWAYDLVECGLSGAAAWVCDSEAYGETARESTGASWGRDCRRATRGAFQSSRAARRAERADDDGRGRSQPRAQSAAAHSSSAVREDGTCRRERLAQCSTDLTLLVAFDDAPGELRAAFAFRNNVAFDGSEVFPAPRSPLSADGSLLPARVRGRSRVSSSARPIFARPTAPVMSRTFGAVRVAPVREGALSSSSADDFRPHVGDSHANLLSRLSSRPSRNSFGAPKSPRAVAANMWPRGTASSALFRTYSANLRAPTPRSSTPTDTLNTWATVAQSSNADRRGPWPSRLAAGSPPSQRTRVRARPQRLADDHADGPPLKLGQSIDIMREREERERERKKPREQRAIQRDKGRERPIDQRPTAVSNSRFSFLQHSRVSRGLEFPVDSIWQRSIRVLESRAHRDDASFELSQSSSRLDTSLRPLCIKLQIGMPSIDSCRRGGGVWRRLSRPPTTASTCVSLCTLISVVSSIQFGRSRVQTTRTVRGFLEHSSQKPTEFPTVVGRRLRTQQPKVSPAPTTYRR